VNGPGGDFGQGNEDEPPLGQAGMGNLEAGRPKDGPAGEENVDVEGTGTVPQAGLPAQAEFDRLGELEHFPGGQRGFHGQDGVPKPGLIAGSDGFGPVKGGRFPNANASLDEKSGRGGERPPAVADVAPQADIIATAVRG